MSQGKWLCPFQLECFYQAQKASPETWRWGGHLRFSTCLIWFPARDRSQEEGKRQLNHRTVEGRDGGPRVQPLEPSSWTFRVVHRASWDQGSRARLVGSLADQQPGLGTSEPVFWEYYWCFLPFILASFSLPPTLLGPGTMHQEGQASFLIHELVLGRDHVGNCHVIEWVPLGTSPKT